MATPNLGWERIWREQGGRWELQTPEPEVMALAVRLKAEGKRRVHDLGCGLGRHLLFLATEGFDAGGSDISPQAVATCQRRLAEAGLPAQVTLREMSAIPEETGSLDCVLAWHVVHHGFIADMARTLRHIHTRLRPGGYLFATFASTQHSACELARRQVEEGLAEELEPSTYVMPGDTEEDKALPHHYATEEELRGRLLEGFEVLSLAERREGEGRVHWLVLARATARMLPAVREGE